MSTFLLCARKASTPSLAIALAGAALTLAARGDPDPTTQWLRLAAFLVPLAAVLRTVALWPAFATDAPAREWVCRSAGGAVRTLRAAVLGGALAALAALFALLVAASPRLPTVRAHVPVAAVGRPCLDENGPELAFPIGFPCSELQLRPIVLPLGDALVATRVRVLVDGHPAAAGEVLVSGDRQLVRIPLDDRAVARVVLQRTSGTLSLWFDERAAVAVASEHSSSLANAGLCALALSLPALVALAVAAALAPFLRGSSALVTAGGAVVLQTLGRIGPAHACLQAVEHGHWLLREPVFWPGVASLATGFVAMIAAMATHAERRR